MKNAKKLRKILVASTLLLGMLAIGGTSSQAALQANPTTHKAKKRYTGATLIKSIREMETSGQTMGLNETVNASSLLSSTSNDIDVHMMKSTEYGAVAILSVSGFGNPNKLQDTATQVKSTTGNVTGVYMGDRERYEWTAGICDVSATVGAGTNARYYDKYTIKDQTSAKIGDALGKTEYVTNPGCSGWHSTSSADWLIFTNCGFVRGGSGIFYFNGSNGIGIWSTSSNYGRGVAVVGSGL